MGEQCPSIHAHIHTRRWMGHMCRAPVNTGTLRHLFMMTPGNNFPGVIPPVNQLIFDNSRHVQAYRDRCHFSEPWITLYQTDRVVNSPLTCHGG
jgi:hypothetical protein